jgi:hypothetical protein
MKEAARNRGPNLVKGTTQERWRRLGYAVELLSMRATRYRRFLAAGLAYEGYAGSVDVFFLGHAPEGRPENVQQAGRTGTHLALKRTSGRIAVMLQAGHS